jgi:Flp pilus assembly protein CpaB
MNFDDQPDNFSTPPGQRDGFGVGGFQALPDEPEEFGKKKRGRKMRKASKKSAGPQSRHTKKVLSVNRIFAILLAFIALVLILASLNPPAAATTYVVRSTSAIPALSIVSIDNLEAVALPDDAIEPGAITGATEEEALANASVLIDNSRTRSSIPAGRQVHPDDFTGDALIEGGLEPDQRLVSVSANVNSAVGGNIKAGDHVDVIGIVTVENTLVANVIASDLEVVSVLPSESEFQSAAQQQVTGGDTNKSPSELLPGNPIPGIYVVKATVEQSIILGMANQEATLYLSLRGGNAVDQDTVYQSLVNVILGSQADTLNGDIPASGDSGTSGDIPSSSGSGS